MPLFESSRNFIWQKKDELGAGTMGIVYKGANNKTGEMVAIKTFNGPGVRFLYNTEQREIEVLRRVCHKNVVKLIAIEEDYDTRRTVIVMELCSGGSLLNMLQDPANSYGLPGNEFLRVLEHLTAGMKHLRDNKIVHRDVKPGNIMVHIGDDGQTIYKLADFGTARELDDNESFTTLVGTEEYLRPDMFKHVMLQRPMCGIFSANIDLWSIGVTLYHVATGRLPFHAYGERRDRETMYEIITKKGPGVISGIQLSKDGPIEWSSTLPSDCQLSDGLKTLITPLLVGLFESDPAKTWSFERYFQEVSDILQKKVMHVFYVNSNSLQEYYMEPIDKVIKLRERIERQSNVHMKAQVLLFNKEHLENGVHHQTSANEFPVTTVDNPIFLYNHNDNDVRLEEQVKLPEFPVFNNTLELQSDARIAKKICEIGYLYSRRIEKFVVMENVIRKAVENFNGKIISRLTMLLKKCKEFESQLPLLSYPVNFLDHLSSKLRVCKKEQCIKDFEDARNKALALIATIKEFYEKFVIQEKLKNIPLEEYKGFSNTCANGKANTYVKKLRESGKYLAQESAKSVTDFCAQQLYALEKIKICRNSEAMKTLLVDEVSPAMEIMIGRVGDWFKMAQVLYVKTNILVMDFYNCHHQMIRLHAKCRTLLDKEQENLMKNVIAQRDEFESVVRQNDELISIFQSIE